MTDLLVTGGGTGLGLALVEHYHRAGVQVMTCGRREEPLRALEASCPGVVTLVADVATQAGRDRLTQAVQRRFGGLDGVIHNAGVQASFTLAEGPGEKEGDDASFRTEVEVNLVAPIALSQRLYPLLADRRGFVATISSSLAYLPHARFPTYCATKAGLSQFTRAAAAQSKEVRFVEVVVPLVDTPMTAARPDLPKMSAPAAAVEIAKGLAGNKSTVWVGEAARIPIFERLFPGAWARRMNRAEAVSFDRESS